MPVISVGTENSGPINLYYEDYGSGAPVILIHGYPLSGRAWDKQVPPLLAAGHRVITYDRRDEAYNASFNVAVGMSAIAVVECVTTWQADFRADLPKIDVPVLVVQGDADRVLPFDKTGKRLPGLIADVDLKVIEGGPHGIPWTHADEVNKALLDFLS